MIECRLLGPVELDSDGDAVPAELKWRKNVALLVYLARSGGKRRSRDHLVNLLWGEKPETAARHSLREALRTIKKGVHDECLGTEGEQVWLEAGFVRTDVDAFVKSFDSNDLESAWSLVGGEFMEGFNVPDSNRFEDWLHAERDLWGNKASAVALQLAERLEKDGNQQRAADVLARARRFAPESEEVARSLMRSQALTGNRSGAIQTYRDLAKHLEDLGASPEDATEALHRSIVAEKEWQLPEDVPGRPGDSRRLPLVGRATALREATGFWNDSRGASHQTIVLVTGPPGAGKTRLAQEVAGRARLDGAAVTTVRAVPADRAQEFAGVIGIARGGLLEASGLSGADPEVLRTFAAVLTDWRERFGTGAAGEMAPGRALSEAIAAVTEEQACLVLVDDAQWLDPASLETIEAMTRDLADRPLMFLLTLNETPEEECLDRIRARIGRELAGTTLKLGPLSTEEIEELAHLVLTEWAPDQIGRLARRIAQDTAGLPLLTVELLYAIANGLDLDRLDTAWPEPFKTLDQTMPGDLPDAIVGAIRVGFRKLSPDAQEIVAAAATIGGRTTAGDLGRATGLEGKTLAAALDESEWKRWLQADGRGYSFVARIVAEVVNTDLVAAGKRERIRSQLGS